MSSVGRYRATRKDGLSMKINVKTLKATINSFNAARSILCVGTLSSPALVPSGLRSRFGKSSIFRADFAAEMRSPNGKSRGRSPLLLVRRGMRRFGKSER